MRRALVVANWKMHGGAAAVAAYADAWNAAGGGPPAGVDVVVCPPWAYLDRLAAALGRVQGGGRVRLGVQSTAAASAGAFTGEHAAEMARDLGAEYAIVGHSERRRLFGETDSAVADKLRAAERAGLVPILCVGETLEERRRRRTEAVVLAQLDAAGFAGTGAAAVVAYEPVWAIGTGETATPAQAQSAHAAIRRHLGRDSLRILYGGSVNADNAARLFAEADIDGGLVGGASLDAGTFADICCAAARARGAVDGADGENGEDGGQ